MQLDEVLIPLALFVCIFGIFYVHYTTRNKERLAMIEKGADASLFYTGRKRNRHTSLKWGMFLVGIGLGLLIGNIIAETTRLKEEVAYFSMTFVGGGVALILFYMIEGKLKSEE